MGHRCPAWTPTATTGGQRQKTSCNTPGDPRSVWTPGNLFYVGGNQLTLVSLARALADTGAGEGWSWTFIPDGPSVRLPAHQRSAPTLGQPAPADHAGTLDRYLQPDQRDFVAVTLR